MSLQFVGLIQATISMRNTTGPISVPGLKVGDKVIGSWIIDLSVGNNIWIPPHQGQNSAIEASVSVDDEIQVVTPGESAGQAWQIVLVRNG
jgi:hypothetical protein